MRYDPHYRLILGGGSTQITQLEDMLGLEGGNGLQGAKEAFAWGLGF